MDTKNYTKSAGASSVRQIVRWAILAGVLVICVWLWFLKYHEDTAPAEALFTGLAFWGVILTVLLQRQELQLQRQELAETREEIRGQRLQMELQNQTQSRQQFEATFFQLLNLLNSVVTAMDFDVDENTSHPKKYVGWDCLKKLYDNYRGIYYPHARSDDKNATDLDQINGSWVEFFRTYQTDLSHYYRLLYNIIKYIDRSDREDKKFYSNIVRAQLSNFELGLLTYNCISPYGKEKFRPLVLKYDLIKNIPPGILIDEHHRYYLSD